MLKNIIMVHLKFEVTVEKIQLSSPLRKKNTFQTTQ